MLPNFCHSFRFFDNNCQLKTHRQKTLKTILKNLKTQNAKYEVQYNGSNAGMFLTTQSA